MRKVGLFFLVFSFLSMLTACGQTGSLYYPKPQKQPPRKDSITKTPPTTSTSVKKSEVVI